ncbi:MAG: hypothetical protein ACXAC5_18865 [Promethearchaeota archaeon]|jgi:hypothetical protein
MSFKSKGPKSHPNHSPKVNPEPPKSHPVKDSKSANQKPKPDDKTKNSINLPPPNMNKDAKNTIINLTSQPNKEPSKPKNGSKNRIIRPIIDPNQKSNNKIRLPTFKPNQQKGSKNIISRLVFEPNKESSSNNKITRLKFDPHDGVKNKIKKHKIDPDEQHKNRIIQYKINKNEPQQSKNKIIRPKFDPNQKSKNKITIPKYSLITKTNNKPQNSRIKTIPSQPKSLNLDNKRYSEKDVRNWITYYQKYKNYERVQNQLRGEGKKVPAISTLKNRIKELIGKEKYKELMKKYTFDDAIKIVYQAGISKTGVPGKILSYPNEFKGVKSKLMYQCGKCDYSWKTTLDAIINSKNWCLKCAAKNRVDDLRGSVAEHQNIITQKGGKLKGVIYEDPKEKLFNQRTRFNIKCEAGHKFNISARSLKQGSWCRKCSYEVIGEKLRGSFQDIQTLIKQRGGKCLSKPEDYKNQHVKLKIQCSENHIFERAPTNFIRGDWCPQCSQGKFESFARKFFEEIFQKEFPKERPNWLVNSRGNQMELDGHNKELKLAFEAQGEQHYRAVAYFNQTLKDLRQRKEDDLMKMDLCKQNDVILIQVPYYIPPSKMQQYIINQYESLSNQRLPNIPDIDYNKFYNTKNDQKKMDNYL